jgi:hypothetical protein
MADTVLSKEVRSFYGDIPIVINFPLLIKTRLTVMANLSTFIKISPSDDASVRAGEAKA